MNASGGVEGHVLQGTDLCSLSAAQRGSRIETNLQFKWDSRYQARPARTYQMEDL